MVFSSYFYFSLFLVTMFSDTTWALKAHPAHCPLWWLINVEVKIIKGEKIFSLKLSRHVYSKCNVINVEPHGKGKEENKSYIILTFL